LSCFVLTRKVGRTMIALGLVLYIFVSVSFMVTKEMYNFVPKVSRPTSKLSGASMGDPSEILEPWLGPFSDEYVKKCFNCLTSGSSLSKAKCAVKLPFCIITNLIKWIRDLILSIKELFEVLATVVGSSLATMYAGPLGLEASKVADRSIVADAADLYSDSIPWIMCYAVPMFLFPVILFAIVATAGKAIAQAIGGEVDMVSVMLLV